MSQVRVLNEILATTRTRVEKLKRDAGELRSAAAAAPPPRPFATALRGADVAVIAEIKRRSPSRGPLAPGADATAAAADFARGGAAAISVLTEPHFFDGSLDDLAEARGAGLPLLMKDFVLDPIQIVAGRAAGADAVLVIARVLDDLDALVSAAHAEGMEALVEVYDESDMERAAEAGATLIGINRRDLETFAVDPDAVARLIAFAPSQATVVGLSGVHTRADVADLAVAGVDAVLVGEALSTSADRAAAVAGLTGVAR